MAKYISARESRKTESARLQLFRAVWRGRRCRVKQLLAQGVDVNQPLSDAELDLFYPEYDPDGWEYVLQECADPNYKPDDEAEYIKLYALQTAVEKGDTKTVRMLLAAGADVLAGYEEDESALIDAVDRKHEALAEFLIKDCKLDVNINAGNEYSEKPLLCAMDNRMYKTMRLLLEYGACPNLICNGTTLGDPILTLAAAWGNCRAGKILLEYGADIERSSLDTKRTPFVRAVYKGNYRFAKMLYKAGADPFVKDAFGFDALHYATDRHHHDNGFFYNAADDCIDFCSWLGDFFLFYGSCLVRLLFRRNMPQNSERDDLYKYFLCRRQWRLIERMVKKIFAACRKTAE